MEKAPNEKIYGSLYIVDAKPEWLRSSGIPEEYLLSISVSVLHKDNFYDVDHSNYKGEPEKSWPGVRIAALPSYTLSKPRVTIHVHPSYVLSLGRDVLSKVPPPTESDFDYVERTVLEDADGIFIGKDDHKRMIKLSKNITQPSMADLIERYKKHFKEVRIDSVVYSDIPQSVVDAGFSPERWKSVPHEGIATFIR